MAENNGLLNYSLLMFLCGALWGAGSREIATILFNYSPTVIYGIITASCGALGAIVFYVDASTRKEVDIDG